VQLTLLLVAHQGYRGRSQARSRPLGRKKKLAHPYNNVVILATAKNPSVSSYTVNVLLVNCIVMDAIALTAGTRSSMMGFDRRL
jgi:hypothetical protein